MKKRGFTLIELLAVIVILAIIALISTPIIIGVIDKARKGAFEDSAYGVLDAGRLYFIDKLADNNTFAGETFDFTKANNLKLSGEAPAGGTLVLDNSGRQALAIYDKDKRWCVTKTYDEEKVTVKDYVEGECKAEGAGTPSGGGASGSITDKNTEGNTDGLFTDDYGNIRYRGASPKNYVTFNNEVWRIIGIVDGKVKLISDEKMIDLFVRNSTADNEWVASTAEFYLNNDYFNNNFENVAKNQTADHTYKLGGIVDSNINSKDCYKLERGTTVSTGKSTEWTGKIGLPYPSDYGYAAGSGCTQLLNNYSDTTCKNANWMYKNYSWWLLTARSSGTPSVASYINSNGFMNLTNVIDRLGIRIVLHLKSTVKITGGDGTQANPYTLS